jgi:ribosome-associated protein
MARLKTGGTKLRGGGSKRKSPGKGPAKKPGKAAREPARPAPRVGAAVPLGPDTTRPLALAAVAAARDKKGERPLLLDVRGISSYADYLLLVSADSERQVQAIGDAIEERLKPLGTRVLGVEQPGESGWMLVDLGDLVVHLFFRGAREAYNFEGLWVDAPRVPLP